MDPISIMAAGAGALEVFKQVKTKLDNSGFGEKTSLIQIAQVARVEPTLVIDSDCMTVDFLGDIVASLHTQFSAYYLQAANLLTSVSGVAVAKKLAPLNPNRSLRMESHGSYAEDADDWRMCAESYRFALPMRANRKHLSLEAITQIEDGPGQLREAANLSTGKLYNVKVKENGQEAIVPVSIRLLAHTLPSRSMVNMFTVIGTDDKSAGERYHGWRSGRLAFWRDVVGCRDLLRAHAKALIKDKDGVYSQIIGRDNTHRKAGLFNGAPSLASASTLAVISSTTLGQIEQAMGGKISTRATKRAIFDNTSLMILAVVDKQFGIVTFYFDGIAETLEATQRDLRSAGKGNGSEVMDIMKAFIAGSTMTL